MEAQGVRETPASDLQHTGHLPWELQELPETPVSDPLDTGCLPLELQERLLSLLDVGSLARSRCVSRSWCERIDSSGAWVRAAGSLGLATEPRGRCRQRVFHLMSSEGSVSEARLPVSERDGGLTDSEVLLHAEAGNGQLRLLIYNQQRCSVRWSRIKVINCDSELLESHQRQILNPEPRDDVILLPCCSLAGWSGWYAVLPVRGIAKCTSPLTLVHQSMFLWPFGIRLHNCWKCSQTHVLASSATRLSLIFLQPRITERNVQDFLQMDLGTRTNMIYSIVPSSDATPGTRQIFALCCESARTKMTTVILVRPDCHRLQILSRIERSSDHFFYQQACDSALITFETSMQKSQDFVKLLLTRHTVTETEDMIADACEYEIPKTGLFWEAWDIHKFDSLFWILSNATHFFALVESEDRDENERISLGIQGPASSSVFVFRFGRSKPILQMQVFDPSIPNTYGFWLHTPATAEWSEGLNSEEHCTQMFARVTDHSMEIPEVWCWNVSLHGYTADKTAG